MAAKYEIKRFNGSNFSLWKMRIKTILRKDNCLAAIRYRPAQITDNAKWNEMDGNAIANIHLALADKVLSSVVEKKTAKEIQETLTKLYESKFLHNKIFLKWRLYTLRMAETTAVIDHINTIRTLFSQLTMLGQQIEENERAELLLQSLPDSYDQLIINLTNNILSDYLVFDDVAAAILEEENRRRNKRDKNSSNQAQTLLVSRGRSTEHGSSGSQRHERSKPRSKKTVKCYNCGRKGHFKKDCWFKRVQRILQSHQNLKDVASTSEDGEVLYSEAATVSTNRKELTEVWVMDSGATWHMTPNRDWFHTYEPSLKAQCSQVMIMLQRLLALAPSN